jgi:hypothetical protein
MLIIRRDYSVYAAVGSISILPTAGQHKCMTYTNCCIYIVVLAGDEQ